MNIDLSSLYSGIDDYIEVDSFVTFPKEEYNHSDIIDLKDVWVNGTISINTSDELECNFKVKGDMILEDSISLEEISYPFTCEICEKIEENEENFENRLDILPILWENIVLEVPLRFTKEEDLSKFSGDGWKIISEEELNMKNNPFNDID